MNNVYLIYGNDYSIIKREIDNIKKDVSDVVKYDLSVDKIDELLDDASCISILDDKKVLIGENALFLTTNTNNVNHDLDYLSNYLNDTSHDNIVILTVITDKLDERKKIVKLIKQTSRVINKSMIDDKNLPNFIIDEFKLKGYTIDFKTANYFVDYIGKNVDVLISEIEKMIIYKEDDKLITIKDINDISCKGFKDNVFDLTDGIMKRDFRKVFECYKDLIILGEEPNKIISLLASQFLLTYQVKLLNSDGKSSKEIADVLKVHPYRVKLALETDYLIYELESVLKKLHELDYNIKSGKIDKKVGLENFLLNI